MIFINALLQVVDDIELRIHLRSQLTTSGLTRIISVSGRRLPCAVDVCYHAGMYTDVKRLAVSNVLIENEESWS